MHGGSSARGLSSGTFKTGRYSKYLPTDLRKLYAESLRDPERHKLDSELALVDARLKQLLPLIKRNGSGSALEAIAISYDAFRAAMKLGDQAKLAEALDRLSEVINSAQSESGAWREIVGLLEQKRRLLDSAVEHAFKARQVITAEEAMNFVTSLGLAVRDVVQDRDLLTRIQRRFDELTGHRARQLEAKAEPENPA